MIPKLRQGKYKMSLIYLVIPESEKVLQKTQMMGECHKDTEGTWKELSLSSSEAIKTPLQFKDGIK